CRYRFFFPTRRSSDLVLNSILKQKNERTIVIPGSVAYIIYELFAEKEALLDKLTLQMKNQELMMKHIRDGMIIVDRNGIVQFVRSEEHTSELQSRENL